MGISQQELPQRRFFLLRLHGLALRLQLAAIRFSTLRWLLPLMALMLQLSPASAHITTICTSTAKSQCASGKIVFYFGTYHDNDPGGSVPGAVFITKPNGDVQGGASGVAFSNICGVTGNTITSSRGGTPTCPEEDIKANCPADAVPDDVSITCYGSHGTTNSQGVQTTYATFESCDAFPATSGPCECKSDTISGPAYALQTTSARCSPPPVSSFRRLEEQVPLLRSSHRSDERNVQGEDKRHRREP